MANPYFRQIPNFSYVSRIEDSKKISQYIDVKNFFKRAKLRPDISGKVEFFTSYIIVGDERPDNVAYKFYNDSTLDWVVLISNNILNIQSEWPLPQTNFDAYLLEKYGSYENIYSIHHYETKEVKNSAGTIVLPAKLKVSSSHQITFYDILIDGYTTITDCVQEITNYQYEEELNNKKREIFILKPDYLRVVFDDIETIMEYKKGSTQYVSGTLKKADNIRLYS
jgi:hypothetical protein